MVLQFLDTRNWAKQKADSGDKHEASILDQISEADQQNNDNKSLKACRNFRETSQRTVLDL